MSNSKEKFINILREIKREGMDKLISWLESTTFFVDPASSKFHGNWEGGLCEHSLAVYEEFQRLTGRFDDSAKIACLLHDVCKIGNYKKGFRNVKNAQTGMWEQVEQYEYNTENQFPYGHGEKSVLMIREFIKLTKEEMLMIRWHMGAYESKECWNDLGEAQKQFSSVLYIHFADMIASKIRGL